MKIARRTKEVIDDVKTEAAAMSRRLDIMVIRLEEHPGTKRITSRLSKAKRNLDDWIRT